MLRRLPAMAAPDLLAGTQSLDDAAVYRLRDDLAVAVTTDIFPPIVDDAYNFGAIAAANALSDLYAMGATPLLALNVVCWPRDGISFDVLAEVQRGAAAKVLEAGAVVAGGHSIDDPEPKFGLVALGTVHPEAVSANSGARPDDLLMLTKPLGTGVITTAIKHDAASPQAVRAATDAMLTLNAASAQAARQHGAHAVTDVTGYGLLGHLREMAQASGVSVQVDADAAPTLPEVWPLIAAGYSPGGAQRNLNSLAPHVHWGAGVDEPMRQLLADPQTSGGLLIAIPPEDEAALRQDLQRRGAPAAAVIGRAAARAGPLIHVRRLDAEHG